MLTSIMKFFSSDTFMPHGHCYLWRPDILWLNVGSDALIALAYFIIPLALIQIVRKRRDLAFNWVFMMFAAFIVACGLTHIMDILTVWYPHYGTQGLVKLATATVSLVTAAAIWRLMPKVLAIPNIQQVETMNHDLQREIATRKSTQEELSTKTRELIELERHRGAARLRESETHFRYLVDGVKDYAIFLLDRDGMITTWNTGAERMKGFQSKEIVGRHFSVFYPDEKIEHGYPATALSVASEMGKFEDEGWQIRKDGSRFWANYLITALRDDSGNLCGFSKVTRDITEKKRSESLSSKQAERTRSVVDHIIDGIITINDKFQIESWNAAAKKTFGYDAREVIGQNVKMLMPEPYHSQHDTYVSNYLTTGHAKVIGIGREVVGRRKNGLSRPR